MKIHYFQHVPYEGLGALAEWAIKPANFVTATRFYDNDKLPFVDAFDLLIVLGGPMSTCDEAQYPWLIKEKELIAKAIAKNKMVIGICLGAQLVAEVLGAKVYPNTEKEIGYFPVQFLKQNAIFTSLPSSLTVFHWHGATFDLPPNAQLIASSEVTKHQAYWLEPNVLGFQFHLETNESSLQLFIENGKAEIMQTGKWIQKEHDMLKGYAENNVANQQLIFQVLNDFVKVNQ